MALSHQRFGSVIRRQWAWLLAGCFSLVVLEAVAARSAPLPPGFSAADAAAASLAVFRTGNTYDVRRSTWRAEVVELADAIPTGPNRWQGPPPSSDHWGDFARLVFRPAGENPSQGFRTTIVVPDDVRDAALCLDRQPSHKIYVNGTLVGQYKAIATTPPALKKYSDLGRYFHKGSNCIAVEAETLSRWGLMKSLLLEGAVRCTGGQIVRIVSDARWKAAYQPAPGWTEPGFDDSGWKSVISKGKPAAGYGPLNHAFYLNPPYYGPIDLAPAVRGRYFFYDAGKPLEIPVSVLPNAAPPAYDVAWRLDGAETGRPAQQGLLGPGRPGDLHRTGRPPDQQNAQAQFHHLSQGSRDGVPVHHAEGRPAGRRGEDAHLADHQRSARPEDQLPRLPAHGPAHRASRHAAAHVLYRTGPLQVH